MSGGYPYTAKISNEPFRVGSDLVPTRETMEPRDGARTGPKVGAKLIRVISKLSHEG